MFELLFYILLKEVRLTKRKAAAGGIVSTSGMAR